MAELACYDNLSEATRWLYHHLNYNFYPPMHADVIDAIMRAFNDYWSGDITADELDFMLEGDLFTNRFEGFLLEVDCYE